MELLDHNINDFTHPIIERLNVCINMRKEIEMWLKNPKLYDLKDCSNDRDTKYVLGLFQDIQKRTSATSIQMIEYFYSLERKIEDLELSLEDTKDHMEWVD
jgi:hypothetical protein